MNSDWGGGLPGVGSGVAGLFGAIGEIDRLRGENSELRGRVVRTMLRGTTIYDDEHPDRIQVEPGFGHFVAAAVA